MIIEAIEEGQLLRAVGLVFGDIEIDRNQPDTAPPSAMPRNHRVGERIKVVLDKGGDMVYKNEKGRR